MLIEAGRDGAGDGAFFVQKKDQSFFITWG
jgi:hypothetical protein